MNTHPSKSASQEWSSYNPMATPVLAPVPASPTMCSEPMLEAKMEAPMTNQPACRPARK